MADPPHNSVHNSWRMQAVDTEISRSEKQLSHALEKLDREKKQRLRELNTAKLQFVCRSRSPSPALITASLAQRGSRTPSPLPCSSRGHSPPKLNSISPGTSPSRPIRPHQRLSNCQSHLHQPRPISPSANQRRTLSRSPSSSPKIFPVLGQGETTRYVSGQELSHQSSPLLDRRQKHRPLSGHGCSQTASLTTAINLCQDSNTPSLRRSTSQDIQQTAFDISKQNKTVVIKHPSCDSGMSLYSPKPLPQIVVSSDETYEEHNKQLAGLTNVLETQKSNHDKPSEESQLSIPIRRGRSCSVSSLLQPSAELLRLAKKHAGLSCVAEVDEKPIRRRNSICAPIVEHLQNAPRRDSLFQKYTSRRGSYRRMTLTLQEVISDLSRGINQFGFDQIVDKDEEDTRVQIPLEEWQRLKDCRYLRMPSHDGKFMGNEIDVDDIFDHQVN